MTFKKGSEGKKVPALAKEKEGNCHCKGSKAEMVYV